MFKLFTSFLFFLNTLHSCYSVNSKSELINNIFNNYTKEVTSSPHTEPLDLHLGLALVYGLGCTFAV